MSPDTALVLVEASAWSMIVFCLGALAWEGSSRPTQMIGLHLNRGPEQPRTPASEFRHAA